MSAAHYGTSACLRSFAQVRKSLLTSSLSGQIQVVALEDEFGRFRVWAANIGALQKGHSSLDYRLREAPLVQENVQKLLKEVHDCLQESMWEMHLLIVVNSRRTTVAFAVTTTYYCHFHWKTQSWCYIFPNFISDTSQSMSS